VAATWAYARFHGPDRYSLRGLADNHRDEVRGARDGLLLVNDGPWTKPKVQNEATIQDGTTANQRRLLVQPSFLLLPYRS
jgi:hypothetical protein